MKATRYFDEATMKKWAQRISIVELVAPPFTLVASIRDVTKLRGDIEFASAGSLPNDGKVIDDTRKYQ